ncbi:MAG: YaiO family outer membrane beta-barrel protein, partial [Sphingobacteriales bacterium]
LRQGYPDSAKKEFRDVRALAPDNERAINELFAIEDQRKAYEEALSLADTGLRYFPASENFLFKKAAVLGSLNRPIEAYPVAAELVKKYPQNEKGKVLADDLYLISRQNRIGVNYNYTFFDPSATRPWNMGSIFYMREEKYASIGARISYADRSVIGGRGYQFELEAYPKHRRGYSYINLAYSNSLIFPNFRFGYSLYQDLNKGWEGELAVRMLQAGGRDFYTLGGSIGRYVGKYWFSVRPFVTTHSGSFYATGALNMRRYFEERDSYIYAVIGTGVSPDDRGRQFEFNSRINLSSYNAAVGIQQLLLRTHIAGVGISYNRQELVGGRKRNEFDVNLSWQIRF